MSKFLPVLALATAGFVYGADAIDRLPVAAEVFKEVMSTPDKAIPQDLLSKAQCVVIVPGLKKGAFIVGGKYGRGFVECRKSGGVGWSAPGSIRVEGGSFGFQIGGAGPHDIVTGDPLGGRLIYTQSTELHYPLPISADIGLSGRAFVDVGGLTQSSFVNPNLCPTCIITTSSAPRVGVGVGISWHTQFGLLNVDLTPFVVKQPKDQTQVFRFGFGTRF